MVSSKESPASFSQLQWISLLARTPKCTYNIAIQKDGSTCLFVCLFVDRAKPVWMQYQRPHIVLDKDDKVCNNLNVVKMYENNFWGVSTLTFADILNHGSLT